MDNYEAIMKMDRGQMEAFLDNVYCAGLNDGMYAARQSEDEADEILDANPFDAAWLSDKAEPAMLGEEAEDGDEYLLNAFEKAVLRNAEIDVTHTVSKTEKRKTISVVMTKKKQTGHC